MFGDKGDSDVYHALNEEYGLYEAEKSVIPIPDKSIVLTGTKENDFGGCLNDNRLFLPGSGYISFAYKRSSDAWQIPGFI